MLCKLILFLVFLFLQNNVVASHATGKFCGGIAGIPCPSGYQCVDNPNDGCDPKKGGRDCGGICKISIAQVKFFSPKNFKLKLPKGTKLTCLSKPCPYLEFRTGGSVYALSYNDNRVSLALALYESDGNLVNVFERKGARYIKKISINLFKKNIKFIGQSNRHVTMAFEDFATGMIFVRTHFSWNVAINGDPTRLSVASKLCAAQKLGLELGKRDVLSCYVGKVAKEKRYLWVHGHSKTEWKQFYINSFLRESDHVADLITDINEVDDIEPITSALEDVGYDLEAVRIGATFVSVKIHYIDSKGNSVVDRQAVKRLISLYKKTNRRLSHTSDDDTCVIDVCWKSVYILDRAHPVVRFTYPNGSEKGCRGGPDGLPSLKGNIITHCGPGNKNAAKTDLADYGVYEDLQVKYDPGDCIPIPGPCNYNCYDKVMKKIEDKCIKYHFLGPNCATVVWHALALCAPHVPDGGPGWQPGYRDFARNPTLGTCKKPTGKKYYFISGAILLNVGLGMLYLYKKKKSNNIEYEYLLQQSENL